MSRRSTPRRPQCVPISAPTRAFSTASPTLHSAQATTATQEADDVEAEEEQGELGRPISRAEYADLGVTYPSPSDLWEILPGQRHPPQQTALRPVLPTQARPNYLPLAPRLVLTPKQEERPPYSKRRVLPPEDKQHAQETKRLKELLRSHWQSMRVGRIWAQYMRLRPPRPRYLSDDLLHKLFARLSMVEFKTLASGRRYFALLDECLDEGVQLTREEWNTAIAFAGRWVKHTSKEEVKAAVETWMRMDTAGHQPDNVTFNILFDVAARAGRFALADTIAAELEARELPLNRYFRTSVIHYAGIRGSGDGVRKAFKDLVNAGEIVDTAVMNCVILSLVRSGEAACG